MKKVRKDSTGEKVQVSEASKLQAWTWHSHFHVENVSIYDLAWNYEAFTASGNNKMAPLAGKGCCCCCNVGGGWEKTQGGRSQNSCSKHTTQGSDKEARALAAEVVPYVTF